MRYHHGYGCYGHGGWHQGCGPEPGYGPGPGYGYGWGWDAPDEDPRPYRRRGRPGGTVARQTTAAQLEAYLASLRDEIRAAEQDLRDLGRTDDSGAGEGQT
jgi:hypothetical protein